MISLTDAETAFVIWFEDYREEDRARVGGKNASLGTMMGAGLPVPPGFAVTTDAYALLRGDETVHGRVHEALAALDLDDARMVQKVAAEIREEMESIVMHPRVEHEIRAAYAALCERCGVPDVPVAVRSSATAEDLPDASFAGQQDTYLWVTGIEAVLANVQRCWSSIFTDRAIVYRHEMGFDDLLIEMSVGVQKMVDPRCSGVAFTLNPRNGDRSQVAIDASWGLGEAVVSGEVTPDTFLVDKVLRSVMERTISTKLVEYRLDGETVRKVDVDPDRVNAQCVTDDELCLVAAMARRAEKHYGCPQDVEWAIDRHLPDGDNVILLQARPETVWSRKAATPVAADGYDPMSSIVSTLLRPLETGRN